MNFQIILFLLFSSLCKPEALALSSSDCTHMTAGRQLESKGKVAFIAGFDEGDNHYYTQAKAYFTAQDMQVVDSLYSLKEIIEWLNGRPESQGFDEIHIVSHSNPWRGLSMKIKPLGARVTEEAIRSARADGILPTLAHGVTKDTKVIFHACGLGENESLLKELQTVFTADEMPEMYASPWYSIFGAGTGGHHLSKVYYVQYPTAYSPGPAALARQLAANYPDVHIDWRQALATKMPAQPGAASFYRFNIPVEWTFDFTDQEEMPTLQHREDIMDWVVQQDDITHVLYTFNIPLEKFRWRTKVEGSKLTILAKTTVVCILQPIMQEQDPSRYSYPNITDPALFVKL